MLKKNSDHGESLFSLGSSIETKIKIIKISINAPWALILGKSLTLR